MGLSKKQIDNIMNIVEQAGGKKATLPTLPSAQTVDPMQGLLAQKQNAVTRLNSIGVDTSQMEDPRNPLEQMLNLPEEQSMFLDLLEVINRPQQALFGGIANLQKGKDFGSGFVEGLSGKNETAGGDLIRNAIGEKEDGSIDWTDFAGFALDAFLDPADLALGLVTGGTSIVAGATADLAKVSNALDAGSDAVKLAKEGVEGAQALNNVKKLNMLGIAQNVVFGSGNRLYIPQNAEEYIKLLTDKAFRAEKGIQKISVTDSIFRTAGSTIKVGGAFADTLVESTLGKVDNSLLETYKAFKNQFSETMKNTAGAVKKAVSASEQRLVSTYEKFTDMFKEYDDTTRMLAQKANMSVPQFQRSIMTVFEHDFLPEQELGTFDMLSWIINSPNGVIRYGDDTQEALVEMFGKEWIDEFTIKMTQEVNGQEMDFLVFDKDFWNLDNEKVADLFYDSRNSGVQLLNRSQVGAYETTLKLKDPEAYNEYLRIKRDEIDNDWLEQEVKITYDNLHPRGTSKEITDPKVQTKEMNKLRRRLRKEKLVNKTGSEYFLKKAVSAEEVAEFLQDSDTTKVLYNTLSDADKYEYNKLKHEDEMWIDKQVSLEYPKKKFDNSVEEMEYIRDRQTYARDLRAQQSSYAKSNKFLEYAQANPNTKSLIDITSPDDLDNFDLEINRMPKEMQKDFRGLKKLQKEMEDIRAKVADEDLLTKSKVYQNRVKKYADMKQELFEKYGTKAPENVGVHYGDLVDGRVSEGIGKMSGSRDTGHFGTGLYVLGKDTNAGSYASRTANKIDMNNYNLFRVKDKVDGWKLHNGLRELNYIPDSLHGLKEMPSDDLIKWAVNNDNEDVLDQLGRLVSDRRTTRAMQESALDDMMVDIIAGEGNIIELLDSLPPGYKELFENASKEYKQWRYLEDDVIDEILTKVNNDFTFIEKVYSAKQPLTSTLGIGLDEYENGLRSIIEQTKKYIETGDNTLDSASTSFMKTFGYEGVDVRGIPELDNTTYGSVIYNVDGKAPKITKEMPTQSVEPTQQVVKEATKAQPKVPIHRFYTDEQIEAIVNLKQNSYVMEGVNKFKDTITEVQREIGVTEFGKANAVIDLSMQGYATHVKTEDAQKAWDAVTQYANQNNVKGFFAPGNTRVLGTRGYQMSAVEANNVKKAYNKYLWENDEWFQQNVPEEMKDMVEEYFEVDAFSEQADESIMGLMDDKYKAINKNKRTTDMLIAMSIGNPNGDTSAVRFINASSPEPKGFVRLREDEVYKLRKVISETKKYAGEGLYINKLLHTIESGLSPNSQLVIEKHLYNMLNVFEKDPTDALQILDKFTSLYKMLKTSNPLSFNGKNVTGNAFNMWASGMSFTDVIKNWNKATDYIKKFESAKLVDEALRTPEQKAIVDAMTDMFQNGYFDLKEYYKLNDMGEFKAIKSMKDVGKKTLLNNPLTEANMYFNLLVDNHARMALYLYAKENPDYLARLGFDATNPKSAMNAVRMVLFDPKDLSLWEEDYMKRLIPFYTFTRQNLAFQMKNITRNSGKYYKTYKAMNSVYRAHGIDPEEVNQWERDDFYLPIFSKKDGKYIAIKTSLPFSDLINFFQDPVKKVVSSTNPVIKGLYEGVSGTNTFTGRPIENYQGEMSSNIPFISKKTEWEMSQTGLDVPLRTASGAVGVVGDLLSGKDPTKNLGRVTGLTYEGDVEKAKQAREYQKINALLDKIKAVKASGKEVPTIDDIASNINSAKTDDKLAQMQSIVDMINNIKR